MNDPNGRFYKDGGYHLFFQHYLGNTRWGLMHWGHATSADIINWTEQPIALFPDSLGYIYSGSAVVDFSNTSGFGTGGRTFPHRSATVLLPLRDLLDQVSHKAGPAGLMIGSQSFPAVSVKVFIEQVNS